MTIPHLLALALLAALGSDLTSDDPPDCERLLPVSEVQRLCQLPGISAGDATAREDGCSRTYGTADGTGQLVLNVVAMETAQEAAATVAAARAVGEASAGMAPGSEEASEAMGGVFDVILGGGEPDASDAEGPSGAVTPEEAALRELPDLGDGGVHYASDTGLGAITHTLVFSAGATVVKLESVFLADRPGVCTVGQLEPLARNVAGRL